MLYSPAFFKQILTSDFSSQRIDEVKAQWLQKTFLFSDNLVNVLTETPGRIYFIVSLVMVTNIAISGGDLGVLVPGGGGSLLAAPEAGGQITFPNYRVTGLKVTSNATAGQVLINMIYFRIVYS